MILKRKNPTANPDNALQLKELDGLCCGDVDKAVVCKYTVTEALATLGTIGAISIGGTSYTFANIADPSTEAGRELLIAEIKAVLASLGYSTDGIAVAVDGTDLVVDVWYSQVAFDWIDTSATLFRPSECIVTGSFGAVVCGDAKASYEEDATHFIIAPVGAEQITNVVVNDGDTDVYDGALDTSTAAPSGNASSRNNKVYLLISGLTLTGAETFTVTVTMKGCPDPVVITIDWTFA